ncbi:MAG: alpha-glucan family phosphorylase [Caldiserica bacterium]|nr:alpha-glucan family phosphorylase [Caldisericota bacterium]
MNERIPRAAYFCMEFGLHEKLHIYAGGLGILAGDILKAAADDHRPMVGIGILWRQDYTEQFIDEYDRPYDSYHEYRYDCLEDTGVVVTIPIEDLQVRARVWKCTAFGNVPLFLLDTYLPDNPGWNLTAQLYGGFEEERVAQEMILGIGGVRALQALGIAVDIYHFNDSHAVFAGVELIRQQVANGVPFLDALWSVKQHIVFTTHTPVSAGNEVHSHRMLQYINAYDGLTHDQIATLGGDPFSMTAAGIRLSKRANAVSQLHGHTAREMWKNIPGGSDILSITNGVHNGTWQDDSIRQAHASRGDLWAPHMTLKRAMIDSIEQRNGVSFGENVLTIGFARRATPYKRSDLIFSDRQIIGDLLRNHKVQIVLAGKAHPNDMGGKATITNIVRIAKEYPDSVVFLQDYDMAICKMLTRGCDIWLNNPVRPMEASGTSGMKAAMNGVLNLSTLDGWWPEGCKHGVNGWQFGGGYEGNDCNSIDCASLYDVLRNDVIPTYENKRDAWIAMMHASIDMAQWQFSAARMLQDYYEKMYA